MINQHLQNKYYILLLNFVFDYLLLELFLYYQLNKLYLNIEIFQSLLNNHYKNLF